MVENDELNSLIDRYFDAATTPAEERMLRREVAGRWAAGCREPALCEVAAVMGFGLSAPVAPRVAAGHRTRWRPAAAAAAAVVAVAACWWIARPAPAAPSSYIVAEGRLAGNETEALSLMAEQLAEISLANRTLISDVEGQITDLGRSLQLSNQSEDIK